MPISRSTAHKNPWLAHVKQYQLKHPHMPYSEVLQRAAVSYRR